MSKKRRQFLEAKIVHPWYQPSRAGLRGDLRLDSTFEETGAALVRPVRVRFIKAPAKLRQRARS